MTMPSSVRHAVVLVLAVTSIAVFSGATDASAASWPLVRQGNTGANVTTVQHLLTARGYSTGADGIFGSGTKSRVVSFQRSRGLAADGVVGQNTWGKLISNVQYGSRVGEVGERGNPHRLHRQHRQLHGPAPAPADQGRRRAALPRPHDARHLRRNCRAEPGIAADVGLLVLIR